MATIDGWTECEAAHRAYAEASAALSARIARVNCADQAEMAGLLVAGNEVHRLLLEWLSKCEAFSSMPGKPTT